MHPTLDRPSTRVRITDLEALIGLGASPRDSPSPVLTVADAKAMARRWVREIAPSMEGLVAAHLTGGITSLPDQAPFPPGKDIDLHLVVDACSPALAPAPGAFFPIVEVDLAGIPLEAGIKGAGDYADPESVLSNPEIASHLTTDTILFDPLGILAGLMPVVRRDYARREWVRARLQHERDGHAAAMALLPMARATSGAVGEHSILGYSMTFLPAALQVATLSPLRLGGRALVNLRQQLGRLHELDLYVEVLAVLGLRSATIAQVEAFLAATAELFDRAVAVQVSPHPFQHKLNPHQRAYFLHCCRRMIDEGYHREALGWATPFYGASTDVLLADGPETERPEIEGRRAAMLRLLERATTTERAGLVVRAERVTAEVFALAERLIAIHPEIRD